MQNEPLPELSCQDPNSSGAGTDYEQERAKMPVIPIDDGIYIPYRRQLGGFTVHAFDPAKSEHQISLADLQGFVQDLNRQKFVDPYPNRTIMCWIAVLLPAILVGCVYILNIRFKDSSSDTLIGINVGIVSFFLAFGIMVCILQNKALNRILSILYKANWMLPRSEEFRKNRILPQKDPELGILTSEPKQTV